MMLPMTPFDMGVYQARWTRYAQSWVGAQLGLWDEDRAYPQTAADFITRSAQIGPWFSTELFDQIVDEFN